MTAAVRIPPVGHKNSRTLLIHEFGDFVFLRKGVFPAAKTSEPPQLGMSAESAVPDRANATGASSPPSTATVNSTVLSAERQSFSPTPQTIVPNVPTGVQYAVIHYGSIDWTQNCMINSEGSGIHADSIAISSAIPAYPVAAMILLMKTKRMARIFSVIGEAVASYQYRVASKQIGRTLQAWRCFSVSEICN